MDEIGRLAGYLLPVLVPVMGLVALGRGAVATGLVDAPGTRGLTNLVFWFLLPSLLFMSVAGNAPPDAALSTATYFAVAVPLFAISVAIGRLALGLSIPQSSVFALNAVFGNTVMMGIPVISAVWGGQGLAVLLAIVAAHSLILLPLATVLVELGEGRREENLKLGLRSAVTGPILRSLKNPIISSILLAFAWRWIGLPLPVPLRRWLELMGQAAPVLALICLGASLPDLRRTKPVPSVLVATLIKLVVMPLAMAGAVAAAGIPAPAPAPAVMIVTAAMPTGANAFLLARRSDSMIEEPASTMVVATLLAIVTLSMALALTR